MLTEATDGGGTTSDNYVDAEGQMGRYVPRVYDRGGQALPFLRIGPDPDSRDRARHCLLRVLPKIRSKIKNQ